MVQFDLGHRPSENLTSKFFKDRSFVQFGSIPVSDQVETLHLNSLRVEAWFGSIPVTDQVETLYLSSLRIEAWFSSIPVTDQVETLLLKLSKDRNLGSFRSQLPTRWKPYC